VLAQELANENSKVGVSVLCPGTVRTNIGRSSRNRPAHLADAGFADIDIELVSGSLLRVAGVRGRPRLQVLYGAMLPPAVAPIILDIPAGGGTRVWAALPCA